MAIIINPEIQGQQADINLSYCYLYEPLRINIVEDNLTATKLYVDIVRIQKDTGVEEAPLVKYVEFDINSGKPVLFDLMEVVNQLHDSNIYKIATVDDIVETNKNTVVTRYIYQFKVYTDTTTDYTVINKLPINGGREFSKFIPGIDFNQPLNEFSLLGINEDELSSRWGDCKFYKSQLIDTTTIADYTPVTTQLQDGPTGFPEGGVLYWKSRYGGWMFWGFDLEKKSYDPSYSGSLSVGMFESTKNIGGAPYVPVNYTEVSSSYSIELKSLSLSMDELKAVAGINSAAVVYYASDSSGRLELMKMSSASVPLSNLATGGDFSVSLKSISSTSQKTI